MAIQNQYLHSIVQRSTSLHSVHIIRFRTGLSAQNVHRSRVLECLLNQTRVSGCHKQYQGREVDVNPLVTQAIFWREPAFIIWGFGFTKSAETGRRRCSQTNWRVGGHSHVHPYLRAGGYNRGTLLQCLVSMEATCAIFAGFFCI